MERRKQHAILSPLLLHTVELCTQGFLFVVSVITLGAIIIDYGFVLDKSESAVIHIIYSFARWVYILVYIAQLLLGWSAITRKSFFLTFFSGLLLLISLIPDISSPPFAWVWLDSFRQIFGSHIYMVVVVGFFAVLEVSKGVVRFINKKTNPALLLAACFIVVIAVGSILLLFPRSTHEFVRLAVTDAMFVATSAVCVTGLSPVDISQTFSLEGQIVIVLLIQIGGLGVMTITSFFAIFFMGGTGLYNQFALRDMVGSDTFDSLMHTLLYILVFTFVIEFAGAFLIWLSVHSTLGFTLREEVFFSLFHSVSAFCNAGFSTLPGNLGNEAVFTGHNVFYIIISLLVILGGIGFPILMNFKRLLSYHIHKCVLRLSGSNRHVQRYEHLVNINTKVVLSMTLLLIIAGTVAFAVLEWNSAFAGMPVVDKLVQSFFNAVVPRTAGFNSVSITSFSLLTVAVYMLLMWIGGASQSAAGGIKVNTAAVAFANLLAVVKGRNSVTLFKREISEMSVRRAYAMVAASIITIFVFFMLLMAMEPTLSPKALLFETLSAYCTVGTSMDVTPQLGSAGKIVVTILMFIGRVSLLTIMMGFVQPAGITKFRYPKDNVIIN